jgi:acyl dehydratase
VTLNAGLIGKTYPPQAFTVDPARVAAFAAAVGHPGGGVPPTFVTAIEHATLGSVIGDPELGLDYSRVVHGEQRYEWERTLVEGKTITAETGIEDVRSKGGLGFLTVRTEVRDDAERLVVVARSVLIVRGSP